ncbi:MAG: PDZ domain-containing protein, partial [Planctomycetota bacterium]
MRTRWLALTSLAVAFSISSVQAQAPVLDPVAPVVEKATPEPPKPTAQDKRIAKLIASLMPKYHISTGGLSDEISQRALGLYLDRFDPLKLYFSKADVDQFNRYKDQIDDMVRRGELGLAYQIFNRFTQRVDQRMQLALDLLDTEFDFEKDEFLKIDPESTTYITSEDEARDRWRRQIKYALLDLRDDDKTADEARDLLRRRYKRLARRYKSFDNDDLLEAFLTSVTSAFDPHSTYMAPSTLEDFNIAMGLRLQGIGAALREKDGNTVVMNVIPGGAAAKDGRLKADDVIVQVGQGESGEMVDIVEMPLQDVVSMIRGNAGTIVRLGVKAGGSGAMEVYQITR